jgi:hypothetical protein
MQIKPSETFMITLGPVQRLSPDCGIKQSSTASLGKLLEKVRRIRRVIYENLHRGLRLLNAYTHYLVINQSGKPSLPSFDV